MSDHAIHPEMHYLGEDLLPECDGWTAAGDARFVASTVAAEVTCPACLAEIKTHADRRVA